MRRFIAVFGVVMGGVLAVGGSVASAVPGGNGLEDFGVFTCSDGDVTVYGPGGAKAAKAFTTAGDQVLLLTLDVTGTTPTGEPFDFSKTYGRRTGLGEGITCTQHFEDGLATSDIVVTVVPVPPA